MGFRFSTTAICAVILTICNRSDARLDPIAFVGDSAPGLNGATFSAVTSTGGSPISLGSAIGSAGHVAFIATTAGGPTGSSSGLWIAKDGDLTLRSQTGDSTLVSSNPVFTNFATFYASAYSINAQGDVAFSADAGTGLRSGVWLSRHDANNRQVSPLIFQGMATPSGKSFGTWSSFSLDNSLIAIAGTSGGTIQSDLYSLTGIGSRTVNNIAPVAASAVVGGAYSVKVQTPDSISLADLNRSTTLFSSASVLPDGKVAGGLTFNGAMDSTHRVAFNAQNSIWTIAPGGTAQFVNSSALPLPNGAGYAYGLSVAALFDSGAYFASATTAPSLNGTITSSTTYFREADGTFRFPVAGNVVVGTNVIAEAPQTLRSSNLAGDVLFSVGGHTSENPAFKSYFVVSDGYDSFCLSANSVDGVAIGSLGVGANFSSRRTQLISEAGQVPVEVTLVNGRKGLLTWTPELHYRPTGVGSTNWDNHMKWTLSLTPAGVHDVYFDPAADTAISGPQTAGTTSLRSLTVGGSTGHATLNLSATGGTLELANDLSVANGSTISISNGEKLVVHGDFNEAAGATIALSLQMPAALSSTNSLVIASSDSSSPLFAVDGTAYLGGTLAVSLPTGFDPLDRSFLGVFSAGAFQGSFSNVTLSTPLNDLKYVAVVPTASGFALQVLPEPSCLVGVCVMGLLLRRHRK